MRAKGHHKLVPAIVVAAVLAGARLFPAGEAPTIPTPEERAAIEKCLLPMPPQIQVAIALVRDDSVRFLGVERTPAGSRLVDNRLAVFQIGSMTKVFTLAVLVLCNVMNDDVPGERVRTLGRELLKQLEAKQEAKAGNGDMGVETSEILLKYWGAKDI